jgi:hypothetical protein
MAWLHERRPEPCLAMPVAIPRLNPRYAGTSHLVGAAMSEHVPAFSQKGVCERLGRLRYGGALAGAGVGGRRCSSLSCLATSGRANQRLRVVWATP